MQLLRDIGLLRKKDSAGPSARVKCRPTLERSDDWSIASTLTA